MKRTSKTPQRPASDIVDDILRVLGGDELKRDLRLPEDETRRRLLELVEGLRLRAARHLPSRATRRAASNYASKVDTCILELEKLLASHFWSELLGGDAVELDGRLVKSTSPAMVEMKNHWKRDAFMEQLAQIRARCRILMAPLGMGPEVDDVRNVCASAAYYFMHTFTCRPITGTTEGDFEVISGLLYEAATGRSGVSMKRACDRQRQSNLHTVPPRRRTSR